jgi:hypothetical protein
MKGKEPKASILAFYQAIYFAETGLVSELDLPGMTELYFNKDMDEIRAAIAAKKLRHLFVDQHTYRRLGLRKLLQENYRPVAHAPDGLLIYLEPLP